MNGDGQPGQHAGALVQTWLVLPCSSSGRAHDLGAEGLRDRLVPEADAEHGDPASAAARTMGTVTPAPAGVPGPGESSTPATSRSASSSTVTASLRRTMHRTPSWPRYWTRL